LNNKNEILFHFFYKLLLAMLLDLQCYSFFEEMCINLVFLESSDLSKILSLQVCRLRDCDHNQSILKFNSKPKEIIRKIKG